MASRDLDAIGRERHKNFRQWRTKLMRALLKDVANKTNENSWKWAFEYYAITFDDIKNG
jgi:hypothetical protein